MAFGTSYETLRAEALRVCYAVRDLDHQYCDGFIPLLAVSNNSISIFEFILFLYDIQISLILGSECILDVCYVESLRVYLLSISL